MVVFKNVCRQAFNVYHWHYLRCIVQAMALEQEFIRYCIKKVVGEQDLALQQHFLINLVFYARDLAFFYTVKSHVKALGL